MAKYALVIGIAEYLSFAPLDKTTMDAEAVAQLLEDYGNFQEVKRLPTGWNPAQGYYVTQQKLTGKELGEALRTFLLEQAKGGDALVYFTGHGFMTSDSLGVQSGYLATSDCALEWEGQRVVGQRFGVSLDSLNQLIREAELNSLVVLLDCCHSGHFLEQHLIKQTLTAFSSPKDYYLITSSRGFEESYVGKEHSVFTGALLEGLSPENAGSDGQISGDRLFDFIQRKLRRSGQQPMRMGYGSSINLVFYRQVAAIPSDIVFNRENPYLGLRAFEANQAQYFYGRDRAVRALLERLGKGRFLSVIGASGSGKSSLVKAGLFAKLNNPEYAIAQLTPGEHPLNNLIDRLAPLHSQNKPFLLFIDQFEEVFTLCKDDEQRKSFFHLIAEEATTTERQGKIIVAIRGDFLDCCAEYSEIAALVNEAQPTTYMVEPLSLEELQLAITEPAKQHGATFEPGLVEQMAADVAQQPGALPLLQYALRELWRVCIEEVESSQPLLTWKGYNQIGEVGGALDKRADLIYNSFTTESDRALVRRLFLELVELGEGTTVTRRRVVKESLDAIADSPEQLESVLLRLTQERLIVATTYKKGEDSYETCIEVSHESLLSKWRLLEGWIAANRDNIRRKRRFEADFLAWRDRYQQSEEALLSGLWLSDVLEWQQQPEVRLSGEEAAFIAKSVGRRDREIQEKVELAEARAKAEAERAKEAEARALAELEMKIEAEKRAEAEGERAKEAEARVRVQKQRIRLAIASLISVTGLTILAGIGWLNAERGQILALSEASDASFTVNRDSLDPLLKALEAGKRLQRISWLPGNQAVRDRVMEVLPQAVYWVREKNRLEDHDGTVQSVSFSPDGTKIASASYDNTVKLWNQNGEELKTLTKHTQPVMSVSFSFDNQRIATTSLDKTVKLWDREGNFIGSLEDHKNWVYSVSFSRDGKMATSDADGIIKLRNHWNGHIINPPFKVGSKGIFALCFSPNNHTLASASVDGIVTLWDLTVNPPKPKSIPAHNDVIYSVSFSNDGERFVTASKDGTVKIWKQNGSRIRTIEGSSGLTSVNFSRDGKIIAAGTLDGKIQLWDREGRAIDTLEGHSSQVNSISFSPDGKIVSASDDQTVRLWQPSSPWLTVFKAHNAPVQYISFSPDGEVLASASKDNTVKLWNSARIGNQPSLLKEHTDVVDGVIFSPNNKLIVTTGRDDKVIIRDRDGKPKYPPISRYSPLGYSSVSFNSSSDRIAVAGTKFVGTKFVVQLFSLAGNPLLSFPAHDAQILRVRFSPDGKTLATASDERTAKLWDSQGNLQHILKGHRAGVWDVNFSREGNMIATASQDKTVKLWNQNGTLLHDLIGHREQVSSVSFSPNSKILATASDDRTIKLWNQDGTLLATLKGHNDAVNSVSFHPTNNNILASGSSDGTVILWNVDNLTLNGLMTRGCNWVRDYLQSNSQAPQNLCANAKR